MFLLSCDSSGGKNTRGSKNTSLGTCTNVDHLSGNVMIYQKIAYDTYLKKYLGTQLSSIEINPNDYWLNSKFVEGKFLNARLTLKNLSGGYLTSKCDSSTYKVFSRKDYSYSGILPSFDCNDANFMSKLPSFVNKSSKIDSTLEFDIFSNLDLTKRKKIIAHNRFRHKPFLQKGNKFKFNISSNERLKNIYNYMKSNNGRSCYRKNYEKGGILSMYGEIHSHKLSNIDKITTNSNTLKPRVKSDFLKCMLSHGARNTSKNDLEQIKLNYIARGLCKKIRK